MKICIIGSSKRLKILEENLIKANYSVERIGSYSELKNNISADFAVLPIPTLNKDGYINLDGKSKLLPSELLSKISPECKVVSCGFYHPDYKTEDLNLRDDFAYLNAVPTAEGAILYALQNTELALFESEILITGFGRVAKILADRLKAFSAKITIAARSAKDLSYATALGYKTIHLRELKENAYRYNIIFQTIPSLIFGKEILDVMNEKNTIIELSSKSTGTDSEYANSIGINVIHAPALPERVLPQTAGNILTKCILSIITEHK